MTLAAFLVAMVGPLVARILTSLGLSLVALAGLTVAYDQLKSTIMASIGGLPAAAVQLGGLYGIWECVGLVLGAVTFCITWNATSGFWRLART